MSIDKPSGQEEEYFARQEFERKKQLVEERERGLKEEERKRLKELHSMRCPKCGMELVEIDFGGIKIDKCTRCAGVWLDAGELEHVVQAGAGFLGNFLKVFRS
jgi:phage FluMu protein Com